MSPPHVQHPARPNPSRLPNFDSIQQNQQANRARQALHDHYPNNPVNVCPQQIQHQASSYRPLNLDPRAVHQTSQNAATVQQADFVLSGGHHIHQWDLRFDGSSQGRDATDFLFRVESQAQLYGVSNRALVIGIGNLLSGRASQWFWTNKRRFHDATWEEWKHAFLLRHSPQRETNFEIRAEIEKRRQLPGEPFTHYCQDMEALAVRLVNQMQEIELVEVLRRNMAIQLRKALWQVRTTTVDALMNCCVEFEELCRDEKYQPYFRKPVAVNELSADQPFCNNIHTDPTSRQLMPPPPNVEALRSEKESNNILVCWNCRDLGHAFMQCQLPQQRIFCFFSGEPGIMKIKCCKCMMGNARKDLLSHPQFMRPPPYNYP